MSNLSEEEIIKDCNILIATLAIVHVDGQAIQGLLDLYNKEKAEVKKWAEEVDKWRKFYNETFNELKKEKETSHFLQSRLDIANARIYELLERLENK